MRRIMWVSFGFAGACVLGAWVLGESWMLGLTVALLTGGLLLGLIWRDSVPLRCVAYLCLGCSFGSAWFLLFHTLYLQPVYSLDGETAEILVTATDYSYATDYGIAFDGKTELGGRTYRIRAYLSSEEEITPGECVQGRFQLRLTTVQSEKGETYHQGEGIFLLGYQRGGIQTVSPAGDSVWTLPAHLRQRILSIIAECFDSDTYPFAQALLLGESTALDYETQTAFRICGTRHIIAVSGLHISILYGFISLLTLKRRYLTAIVGVPLLALFAAVAGFTPSVTRACIMVCLMMIATATNREYDGPTALASACLLMLIINPLTIKSVSFQLSVISVCGIYLFYGKIASWFGTHMGGQKGKSIRARLTRWFISSVSITLSAISLTTPLCAYYFGVVSLIGVVANLLTLWAVSLVFYGIIAVCAVFFAIPAVARVLAWCVSWIIRYVLAMSHLLSKIPLAAVYTKSVYIVIWLGFVYVLLAAFLLMRKKRPATLLCCGVLALCVALAASWIEPLMDTCRVTVLDVGQGQSILLQSGGKNYLVDCGGSDSESTADLAAETILSQGVTQLDGIIVTHYDDDHAGALSYLLTRVDADLLVLPVYDPDAKAEAIKKLSKAEVLFPTADSTICFANAKITVFPPRYFANDNESSLCVLFETENCAILITGDRSSYGEQMLLESASLPDVDLLIAGHHGSKTSTSTQLLDAVRPETVIISVGRNSYGHPSEEVLQRLEAYECEVYRTDENGTVIFRR